MFTGSWRRAEPVVGAIIGQETSAHACGQIRSTLTLGPQRRDRHRRAIDGPIIAPTKVLSGGSNPALDADQPPLGTKGSEITTPRRPAGHKSLARNLT